MKKILLLLFLIVLLLSCQVPTETTIIERYMSDPGYRAFDSVIVFPVPANISFFSMQKAYSVNTPAQDFANGIMYYENSYYADETPHMLDLGYLTGGKKALVCLTFTVIDHGWNYIIDDYDDEYGFYYITAYNSMLQYKSVQPKFQQYSVEVLVMTDDTGKLEWYSNHNFPFWGNPGAEPQYCIYKWEQIQITCSWLVVGITVE